MIRYDEYRKEVTQDLGTISLYDLEGDFSKAIEKLQQEYEYYSKYLKVKHKIKEENYSGGAYLDKSKEKNVIFDKIYIECIEGCEGQKELRVKGERKLDAAELIALHEKKTAAAMKKTEEEKEQLRKLKEKYPNL